MKINLKNAKVIKSLKGFGGSACWWSPQIKDEKIRDDVANLLYGDSGLKMNIYRFNVGGGYEKNNLRIDNPWRYVESFMLGDGTFDYSKDKYAVSMMKKCLALGNIDTLIFFANSPHYTQTVTGQTSGGFTERFSNLDKSKYEAFAKYFIDIAEHFISEGYPVKYISLSMNRSGNGAAIMFGRRVAIMNRKRYLTAIWYLQRNLKKEIQALSFTALKAEI